jgi:hypothetical protein
VRANPDDQIVVNEEPISGRVGPSIGSVVAGCLTAGWYVVAEFLRLWGNLKPIIVVRRASCSWAVCSRSSSCTTLLIVESGAQDRHHAPLFLLLNRVLKIVVVCRSSYSDHRRVPLWMTTFRTGIACPSGTSRHRCHEFTRTNLSASPLSGAPLSTSGRQIFRVWSEGTQVSEINLTWIQDTMF